MREGGLAPGPPGRHLLQARDWFLLYLSATLIRGTVPTVPQELSQNEGIDCASLDKNDGHAEHMALQWAWPRISRGGVVYMDDWNGITRNYGISWVASLLSSNVMFSSCDRKRNGDKGAVSRTHWRVKLIAGSSSLEGQATVRYQQPPISCRRAPNVHVDARLQSALISYSWQGSQLICRPPCADESAFGLCA